MPLALASIMFAMFVTWRDGRLRMRAELEERAVPIRKLPELLAPTTQVPGTAVFLVSQSGFVPTALLRNLEHNKVQYEQIVILHVEIQRVPRTDPMCRVVIAELLPGVFDVRARFGFMETPDVGEALRNARRQGLGVFSRIPRSSSAGTSCGRVRVRVSRSEIACVRISAAPERAGRGIFRMPARGVIVLATDIEL